MVNEYLLLGLAFCLPAYLCFVWSKRVSKDVLGTPQSTLLATLAKQKLGQHHPVAERLQKLGFSRSPFKNLLMLGGIVMFSLLCAFILGITGFAISFLFCITVALTIAQIRRNNIKLRLVQQLPSFVDQVNRRIKVGLSITQAVEQSARATTSPLKDVLQRVSHRQTVGSSYNMRSRKRAPLPVSKRSICWVPYSALIHAMAAVLRILWKVW